MTWKADRPDVLARLAAIEEVQAAHGSAIAAHSLAIAALEDRVTALEWPDPEPEPEPEPPPETGPLMGAATGNDTAWATLDALVGPMQARRTFEPGFVADFMQSKARHDVATGRLSVWSFKANGDYRGVIAGAWDERLRDLLDTIPDGHPTALVMQHEPENDAGIVAADWRAAQARLGTLVAATGRPELEVVPVLMGWTYDPKSGRRPDDWFDTAMYDAGIRTIGIDEYQPAGSTWQTWPTRAARFTPVIEAWGCRPAICEVGCPDVPAYPDRKVQWINDLHTWALDHGAPFVMWFNYISGIMSSDASYLLDSSPQVTARWSELVAQVAP